jgi:hypothetical protein
MIGGVGADKRHQFVQGAVGLADGGCVLEFQKDEFRKALITECLGFLRGIP